MHRKVRHMKWLKKKRKKGKEGKNVIMGNENEDDIKELCWGKIDKGL